MDEEKRLVTGFFKDMSLSWFNTLEPNDEVREAAASPYFLWWGFLKESKKWPPSSDDLSDQGCKRTYEFFGDLEESFTDWWWNRGRYAFEEQQMPPDVELVQDGSLIDRAVTEEFIYIRVPRTIRRDRIDERFRVLIAKHHPGDFGLREEHATGQLRLNRDGKPSYPKLRQKLEVLTLKNQGLTFGQISGKMPELRPKKSTKNTKSDNEAIDQQLLFEKKLQVIHAQAKKIAEHAARGIFPKVSDRDDD